MGSSVLSKIWDAHAIGEDEDGRTLLYIDRHLTHEVTSPIAFEALREAGRKVRRPDLTFAVTDHNVPTHDRDLPVESGMSLRQMELLRQNARENGVMLFDYESQDQGIVHVIGTELGLTVPGITLACGDSHTSTHGVLGALAFGIGTSEGEHLFATQSLWIKRPREMRIKVNGRLHAGVYAKDVVLKIIRDMGTGGAIGHSVEFCGETVDSFSVEERFTLANMIVEGGARTAIMSPDEKVLNYVRGRRFAPKSSEWDAAAASWRELASDPGAGYDAERSFDVSRLEPQVSWGTNPAMTVGVTETVPSPADAKTERERVSIERAVGYMGLTPGMRVTDIPVEVVFIGSCTNARISDLVEAARFVRGRHVRQGVRALVVPGSQAVRAQAELMGLASVFRDAGFEWRNAGCSMCIAMNGDELKQGQRCASTSNRNFENRQGTGGRTHLVSPATAAAAAIEGRFVDVRELGRV